MCCIASAVRKGAHTPSAEAEIGLFGELATLAGIIDAGAPPGAAVAAWVGPLDAPQDFELGTGAGGVKSTLGATAVPPPIRLRPAVVRRGIDRLALEVRFLDDIVIDQGQSPDARRRTESRLDLVVPGQIHQDRVVLHLGAVHGHRLGGRIAVGLTGAQVEA